MPTNFTYALGLFLIILKPCKVVIRIIISFATHRMLRFPSLPTISFIQRGKYSL